MAIYNGRILMRKGNEADFDASKLMSGEWAVSLDAGIVRICLEAGKVIRMATYEAFEEDMKQIEAILLECQTVEEAVQRINEEIDTKVDAVVEYVGQAKTYRDEALQFRNEAEAFKNQAGEIAGIEIATTEKAGIVKPDGETLEVDADGTMRVIGGGGVSDYSELENKPSINGTELNGDMSLENLGIASATELEKTNTKVDTIIEKADLGITETASGEEIHLIDSAEGKAVEFALYGKAKQNATTGKNLLQNTSETRTKDGITFTINSDGSLKLSGTASKGTQIDINSDLSAIQNGNYILSSGNFSTSKIYLSLALSNGTTANATASVQEKAFSVADDIKVIRCYIWIDSGVNCDGVVIHPMISVDGGEYEPYTNGASPNPSYPQEIEVSGESYNLLEVTANTQEFEGVTFTVNNDKSITLNGTANNSVAGGDSVIGSAKLEKGKYILSGCPSGGSNETYRLIALITYEDGTTDTSWRTFGNEVEINIQKEVREILVRTDIMSGITANNLTFYPMIRKASVKNDRYMPYGVGSVEVKSVGEQLLNYESDLLSVEGLTTTVNNDKSLTINGKTDKQYVTLFRLENVVLEVGNYYISGGSISNGNFYVQAQITLADGTKKRYTNATFTVDGTEQDILITLQTGGYSGDFNCTIYPMLNKGTTALPFEPYKETKAIINGEFAGIKVSSNGNYTDQNGQQWICDEIVKYADGSGAYIQRIDKVDILSSYNWIISSNDIFYTDSLKKLGLTDNTPIICTHAIGTTKGVSYMVQGECKFTTSNLFYLPNNNFDNINDYKAWLDSENVVVYYVLPTPITTPLTAEELAEISTFYPVTNISNDFDCGMKVKYNCDSKNYIDKQLAEMERAREQAMMSMFLLLPEETQATMIENDVNNLLTESEN